MTNNLKLYSPKDLEGLGYGSRVTLWRKVKEGIFPAPLIVDGHRRWTEEMLLNYINSKPTLNNN